jgi:hypothetical protein
MSRSALSRAVVVLCALTPVLGVQAAHAASSWPSITPMTPSSIESGSAAAAKPTAEAPACTRKVKVVYSGYGEAERAGCSGDAPAKTSQR